MSALMSMSKVEVVEKFRLKPEDTGSTEVQVALLTWRIKHLTEHFKTHKHDFHSRYGLQKLVSSRRKLLDYIKRKNYTAYQALLKALELRR